MIDLYGWNNYFRLATEIRFFFHFPASSSLQVTAPHENTTHVHKICISIYFIYYILLSDSSLYIPTCNITIIILPSRNEQLDGKEYYTG